MTHHPGDPPLLKDEPPRIMPRATHDLERARVLVFGIQYELANDYAFKQGDDGDEMTLDLHGYLEEMTDIVRRYHPYSALAEDGDE